MCPASHGFPRRRSASMPGLDRHPRRCRALVRSCERGCVWRRHASGVGRRPADGPSKHGSPCLTPRMIQVFGTDESSRPPTIGGGGHDWQPRCTDCPGARAFLVRGEEASGAGPRAWRVTEGIQEGGGERSGTDRAGVRAVVVNPFIGRSRAPLHEMPDIPPGGLEPLPEVRGLGWGWRTEYYGRGAGRSERPMR